MARKVKDKILSKLSSGPKTIQELARSIGVRQAVVRGQLTRLIKQGKVEETPDGKYKLK